MFSTWLADGVRYRSRLIGSIRASEDVASANMLSKIWDAPLPGETEDTFYEDLRGASRIGKRKRVR